MEQNFPIPLEPVIFNKFTESVTGPNSNVYFDSELTQQMDYEVELALVIGKSGRDISTDEALRHVAGVTVAHDVSSRDWQFQHNENQWLLGKCQDTFCPLGPSLVTLDELPNQSLDNLRITSRLNGVTVQDSTTSEFIFDVPSIINWISTFVTLSPGDVILTGTPSGVGCFRTPPLWLKHGDVVECEIESIGTLRNLMVDKRQAASSGGDGGSGSGSDGSGEMKTDSNSNVVQMFVGTYTTDKGHVDGQGKGVYPCTLDVLTGAMALGGTPMITSNPTYVVRSRSGTMLYTVSEDDGPNYGQLKSGSARTFEIGLSSKVGGNGSTKGVQTSSFAAGGTDTCYVELNYDETFAFVSNYSSGSVAVFPIRPNRTLGPMCSFSQHSLLPSSPSSLSSKKKKKTLPGPVEDRQEAPHAHQARYLERGSWLYVPDLGLDVVVQYKVDVSTGRLEEIGRFDTPPGSGPRHMDWHDEREAFVYVGLEMGNGITVFRRDGVTGSLLEIIQTISSLPEDCEMKYPENSTAQLLVHPNGKFCYVSNRGHDSIGCYSISLRTGELVPVGWYSTNGKCPRNFRFTEDGKMCVVCNQNSDDVYTYHVDLVTGVLSDTGHSLSIPSPVCICL